MSNSLPLRRPAEVSGGDSAAVIDLTPFDAATHDLERVLDWLTEQA